MRNYKMAVSECDRNIPEERNELPFTRNTASAKSLIGVVAPRNSTLFSTGVLNPNGSY